MEKLHQHEEESQTPESGRDGEVNFFTFVDGKESIDELSVYLEKIIRQAKDRGEKVRVEVKVEK